MKFHIVILWFVSVLKASECARIFGMFPTPSISHQVVFRALIEELAVRGHELIVLTADPVNYTDPKYSKLKQIDVHEGSYRAWREHFNFAKERLEDPSTIGIMDTYYNVMVKIADYQFRNEELQKLMNDESQKFDLCIVEGILPLLTAFKDKFNCPLIQIDSFIGLDTNFEVTGNPNHPVWYFDIFNPYADDEINFWTKMELLYLRLRYVYLRFWKYQTIYTNLAKKYFGPDLRPLDDIEKEVDMIFVNSHPVITGVRPLVPAIVQMGSMHLKPPKPLPEDLQKVLDGAKQGAIYMSFGSNVRSCDLPAPILKEFLQAWKSLPYLVLWKWECGELPFKPKNVLTSQWFPQQSILAHKNMKLFITQGGQQSMEESIHHGVPMIGIPFLADQSANVARMTKFSIGKRMFIESVTTKDLKNAVLEIMTNISYHDNIKKLNELINDQPQTALERSVWWTEYVIRHKGAKHLRAPTVGMSYAEYYMIYEISISVIALIICMKLLIYLLKFVVRKVFNRGSKKIKKS